MGFIFEIQADCSLKIEDGSSDMNYFHIEQCEDSTYGMYIDTMVFFENGKSGEINYLGNIMTKLNKFMLENGVDVDKRLNFCEIFHRGYNVNSKFKSLEDLYTTFRFLVSGYKNNL
jgi:hypothetical protein